MKHEKTALIRQLHATMARLGLLQMKEEIYAPYGVTSSKKMTLSQLRELVAQLNQGNPVQGRSATESNFIRGLRSECLRVITGDPEAKNPRDRGLGLPNNWEILNPFIRNHAGKALRELSIPELQQFKRKLFSIRDTGWRYRGHLRNREKPVSLFFLTENSTVN